MKDKIEYVMQQEGEKNVILGIRGNDRDLIIRHYWDFWNHEATSSEDIIWANDVVKPYLGYFWTTKTKLKNALVNMTFSSLLNCENLSQFKGLKGGAMPFARDYAKLRYNDIKPVRFLMTKNKYDFYSLGRITAENLTDYDATK